MSHTSDSFKTKFLLTALPDVPFDGWSAALLQRTAKKLKLNETQVAYAFPYGAKDLIAYFSVWVLAETRKKLKRENLAALRVRDRIALGVKTRLEILTPYKQAHVFLKPKQLWQAADSLWWAAGDTSTDYNHYTKRILLSGVLAATTLYWLNDRSKDHRQTWDFLERRIDNVMKIGQKISSFKKQKAG